jgi:hypothetical protein
MSSDFTVIQPVRQQFGDTQKPDGLDFNAPFVGLSKEFSFLCPSVDPRQMAVLQFESLGVLSGLLGKNGWDVNPNKRNILRINGVDVPGGITPGPYLKFSDTRCSLWKSHTLVVAGGILKERNTLYVEAIPSHIFPEHYHDNFILDNIVIFYKTTANSLAPRGSRSPGKARRD